MKENLQVDYATLISAFVVIICVTLVSAYTVYNHAGSNIVINMPQDASKLEKLDVAINKDMLKVNGDKAVLWWTVYKETARNYSPYVSREIANAAVETAYGKSK